MIRVAGLVLAGGQSIRMGVDKATLPCGKLRMIDHVVQSISRICPLGVWVGGRDYGYPWLSDLEGVRGPMASIAKLSNFSVDAEALIIIPVDMPSFEEKDGKFLINALAQRPEVDAACFDQSHFPLVLRKSERFKAQIDRWLADRLDDSVYAFLKSIPVHKLLLEQSASSSFKNLNYPQDYSEYSASISLKEKAPL